MSVDVHVVGDGPDLAPLLEEWDALADRQSTGFASRPSYGLAWWRELGTGELALVTGRRDGRLVALAPLHRRTLLGQPVLRWLGHGLGTVGELLADDDEAARAVWDALAEQGCPLQLVHVRLDSRSTLALRRSEAWDVRLTVDDRCSGVPLPVGTVSSDLRGATSLKRLRRYRNALAREGRPFDVEVVDDLDGLHRWWPEVQRVAADADRGRDRTDLCGSPYDAFTLPFLEAEARAGRLLIVGGTVGGVWSAHEVGLRHGRRLDLWLSRFDPTLAQVGLGHLVAEAMVDRHDALGIDALDFGIGENAYKAAWTTTGYDVATLLAVPRDAAGPAHGWPRPDASASWPAH